MVPVRISLKLIRVIGAVRVGARLRLRVIVIVTVRVRVRVRVKKSLGS